MDEDFLNTVFCPACGSKFETETVMSEIEGEIDDGTVKCECSTYPIVGGILILKKDNRTRNSTKFLAKNDMFGAYNTLFELLPGRARRLNYIISRFGDVQISFLNKIASIYKRAANRPLLSIHVSKKSKLTFFKLLDSLKWKSWGDYLKYRFSSISFLSALPFVRLISQANRRILDVGSGAGHFSFAISKHVQEEKIVCVDYQFVNLFLAKRYFVEHAKHICLDANFPLPFQSSSFSNIFSLDAFHYITHKHILSKELSRILDEHGVLVLSHLHNSLGRNIHSGQPLTPREYARLFSDLKVKLIPEDNIVEDFYYDNKLNLVQNFSESQLNTSDSCTLVASRNEKVFKLHKNLSEKIMKYTNNLVINPIYEIEENGTNIRLILTFPSKIDETENFKIKKFMPNSLLIKKDLLKSIRSGNITAEQLEKIHILMKKNILINVPSRYT